MKNDAKILVAGLCALLCLGLSMSARSATQFGSLPLWFEASAQNQFIARGQGTEFIIKPDGVEFALRNDSGETARCTMRFVGASTFIAPAGTEPLTGKINRFYGSRPQDWQTGISTFSRVQMEAVYPGISAVFYGNQKMLEYDFLLAAGKDPAQIALRFEGAKTISIGKDGALIISLGAGKVEQHPPVAYQIINGERREVTVGYKLLDSRTVGFAVGNFDRTAPLVIDPVLNYSTYFGGKYGDTASAIAVNPVDGSIYFAGQTLSSQVSNTIPLATASAYQKIYKGGKFTGDAFIARFDNTGTNLIYATYLGGAGNDGALGLVVDADGNAFVAGFTDSIDFPTTNALYKTIRSTKPKQLSTYPVDAFVAKLNPSGSALLSSTYLGGRSMDAIYALALDDAKNIYVTGYTYSSNFPVTPNAFQKKSAFTNDNFPYFHCNAFVSVIAASGTNLIYSSFLGGTNFDQGRAIALNNGRVFVAGYTSSTNFPKTNFLPGYTYLNGNADKDKKKLNGASDAFVAAFQISSTNLIPMYSTLLGGTNNDVANGIAADADGNAYVAGYTMSTNFPYTTTNVLNLTDAYVHTNDFKKRPQYATNGFLTKIEWNGTNPAIGFSTMFGGRGVNVANGVTLDAANNIYIVGSATCTNFPVTPDNFGPPLSATNNSRKKNGEHLSDAVVIVFNQDATALLFSAYLGGKENDYGNAIALDVDGSIYLAGYTTSTNFPTVSPWKSIRTGTNDMFIARISPDAPPTLTIAPSEPEPSAAPADGFATAEAAPSAPRAHGRFKLKWKVFPPNTQLESTTEIGGNDWHPVPQSPVLTNGWYQLELESTNRAEFFRLRRPW